MTELPNLLDGTEQFLRAAEHPIPDRPAIPTPEVIALRLKLLIEEVDELCEAVGFEDLDHYVTKANWDDDLDCIRSAIDEGRVDLPEMVDAFHDIAVIAYGGALETAGVAGAKAAADEVTRSNLSKIVDGRVIRREDGKIMKPEGWRPPNIRGALAAAKLGMLP